MAQTGSESLPDLDDLLQCPVCYEIPLGQIFQCNEGHHVCGRCKVRLEQCPVCRALFFGTRNYAMEELISNVRRLRAFKLGGKVTTGLPAASTSEDDAAAAEELEPDVADADDLEEGDNNFASRPDHIVPPACKGLFRCLCCKNGTSQRLPSGRLINHLRYYHAPELIEGRSESGEYLQAWQFSTVPGRIVTAVRVADMGVFFLVIEITDGTLYAWLTMAASPWVAHEFCYTVTISGNDREAIFSDCVWSVRSCEGSLKKRGHCLGVNGLDARALTSPAHISVKLSVKRVSTDQLAQQTQPRAVMRVARRGGDVASTAQHHLQPFLHDLQNGVERLSRAFATLGREADALVRSEREVRARIQNVEDRSAAGAPRPAPSAAAVPRPAPADVAVPRPVQAAPRAAPSTATVPRPLSAAPRAAPVAAVPRPVQAVPRAAPSTATTPRPLSAAPRAAPAAAAVPRPEPAAARPAPAAAFVPRHSAIDPHTSLITNFLANYGPPRRLPDPPRMASPISSPENNVQLSRNQRRRLRNRLRNALAAGEQVPEAATSFRAASPEVVHIGYIRVVEAPPGPSRVAPTVSSAPVGAAASSQNQNQPKTNKKKRRNRK